MRRIPHDLKKISHRTMPVSDATPEEDATAAALNRHVAAIAQAPRNLWHYDSLQRAAAYIDGEFTQSGYDARYQAYEVMGQQVMNIEAERRGSRALHTASPQLASRHRASSTARSRSRGVTDTPG